MRQCTQCLSSPLVRHCGAQEGRHPCAGGYSWEVLEIGSASGGLFQGANSESDWKMLRTSLSQTTQRFFREQTLARAPPCFQARLYATEAPWVRPPYRPAPTDQPPAETFSSPSRPRQYYARPAPKRELPIVEVNPTLSQSQFHPSYQRLTDVFDYGFHLPFGSADGLHWSSSGRSESLPGSRS